MTSSAAAALSAGMATLETAEPQASLHCCCGRPDCALLKNNCSVLDAVEKDVHTAAQLGQALLARHEAYMADAERDRLELTSRIERLETDKRELEAANAAKIDENRDLLDHLEALNSSVAESDTRIKALEASLLSSQHAVRRLEGAASRAVDAERHLALLEEEQFLLRGELLTTREDARSHAQRCKEAQRGILDMQDQLERMEAEALEEHQRHSEVVGRMERQREVEKQLDTAAGRLKGAAATRSLEGPKKDGGAAVVGHFVRDLLEDNANLQLGMAELREMLLNSNDEIQSLREQLMYHQPVPDDGRDDSATPTLQAELEAPETPGAVPGTPGNARLSQELHIHHHYHVTPKQDTARKTKKKRPGLATGSGGGALGSGLFTPPPLSMPASPSPHHGGWRQPGSPTPASLRPSHDAAAIVPHSWTGFSNPPSELASSLPSSPRSTRHNSMFDPVFPDLAPSTSPTTSFDPMSPTWGASHQKRPSEVSSKSIQSFSRLDAVPGSPRSPPPILQAPVPLPHHIDNIIHEEDEDELWGDEAPELVGPAMSTEDSTTEDSEFSRDDLVPRPQLRRAASHESIMSLSGGLDIHTLKARPSQMTLRPLGGAGAVVTGVVAQPTLSRASSKRSDAALRGHFMGLGTPRTVSGPHQRQPSPSPSGTSDGSSNAGLGRWVTWRPWGGSSHGAARNMPQPERHDELSRTPGINQPGAIPGFPQYWATQRRKGAPAQVTTETVDRDALTEGLQG